MPKDTLADIQRDMMRFLGTAVEVLDEAERLMAVSYMGTEKWVAEVAAWKKRKAVLINCQAN